MSLRDLILARLLTPAQHALVRALDQPERWQPDAKITAAEARNWGAMLASPLGMKLDVSMTNWVQQEAQRALFCPTAEIARTVGFAAGARAGWEMAKTISRMADPQVGPHEHASPTVDAGLAHHEP